MTEVDDAALAAANRIIHMDYPAVSEEERRRLFVEDAELVAGVLIEKEEQK